MYIFIIYLYMQYHHQFDIQLKQNLPKHQEYMNSYMSVDPNQTVINSRIGVCNCLTLRQKICRSFTSPERDYAAYQYVSFYTFPWYRKKEFMNTFKPIIMKAADDKLCDIFLDFSENKA